MLLAATAAAALAFAVDVRPQHLTPGAPLRITVTAPPTAAAPGTPAPPAATPDAAPSLAAAPPSGRLFHRALTFLPSPDGSGWVAFTGVDLDVRPGMHPLTIDLSPPEGGRLSRTLELKVEPKKYPTEKLSVEPKYVEPPPDVAQRIARESADLQALWVIDSAEMLFDGRVTMPVPGVEGRNFGRRRVFNGQARSPHSGLDLSAPEGTPVRAAAAGRVVLTGDHYFSGKLVVIDHGGGIYTAYAHLSAIEATSDARVEAGQTIGRVGATGRVTGAHLHWGARVGGARVDPAALLELLKPGPASAAGGTTRGGPIHGRSMSPAGNPG